MARIRTVDGSIAVDPDGPGYVIVGMTVGRSFSSQSLTVAQAHDLIRALREAVE